jgi:septal ring factor EnvC (AmiA/AmiB activator)
MDCALVESLLPNFLDEELTEELAQQVQAHLIRCRQCAWEAESIRQSIAALREATAANRPRDEARERLWAEVQREHRAAMAARRAGSAPGRPPRPAPVYVLDAEEESDAKETGQG